MTAYFFLVDVGSVGAAQIAKDQAFRLVQNLRVVVRHVAGVELQIVGVVPPDGDTKRLQQVESKDLLVSSQDQNVLGSLGGGLSVLALDFHTSLLTVTSREDQKT